MLFKEFDNWLSKSIDEFDYIKLNKDSIIGSQRCYSKNFDSLNFKDDDVIIWRDFIMSLRLNVLKTSVIKTFIIIAFVFFAILNENRLLSKINKMFIRFFFIKDFFELDFLCEIMTIMI